MLRFVAYSIYSSHLVHQGVALEVVGGGRRVVAPLLRAPVPPRPSTSTARMKLDVSRVPLVGAEGLPALWAVRRGEVGAAVVELEQPPFGAGVRAFRAGEHLQRENRDKVGGGIFFASTSSFLPHCCSFFCFKSKASSNHSIKCNGIRVRNG